MVIKIGKLQWTEHDGFDDEVWTRDFVVEAFDGDADVEALMDGCECCSYCDCEEGTIIGHFYRDADNRTTPFYLNDCEDMDEVMPSFCGEHTSYNTLRKAIRDHFIKRGDSVFHEGSYQLYRSATM